MDVPTLLPLDAQEVRQNWPYLRDGIKAALTHEGSDGTMPEDVFSALMVEQAFCFMARYNDDPTAGPEGFIVTRTFHTPSGAELLVWIGYHNGGVGRAMDYMPQIAELAKATGHARIKVESPRPYHRAIPGMKLARHVFFYEVE